MQKDSAVINRLLADSKHFFDRQQQEFYPIEMFKAKAQDWLLQSDQFAGLFRSSGTSQKERSASVFSQAGLKLYRQKSSEHFIHILSEAGFFASGLRGYSLVPPERVWPDSSLAAMVAAIGETLPIAYIDSLDQIEETSKPVWVIGTAFHFVQAIDSGQSNHLHPDSLIFETGGTKGRSRSVSRGELHHMIGDALAVPAHHILGEYGMCELASQAYDLNSRHLAAEDRRFRFHQDIRLAVMNQGNILPTGRGSLLVYDALRIDIHLPILTQDYVELYEDQSFQILGRSLAAPRKGCSLLAEELIQPQTVMPSESQVGHPIVMLGPGTIDTIKKRSEVLPMILTNLWQDIKLLQALRDFCYSKWTFNRLMEDLQTSGHISSDQWFQAAMTACDHAPHQVPRHWLFIAPNNHPIALFHPMMISFLLGIDLLIKPSRHHQTALEAFCGPFLKHGATFKLASADMRLEQRCLQPERAILLFGSNTTINTLRDQGIIISRAYGSYHSICISDDDAINKSDLQAILLDTFGLNQQGCLSTKAWVICTKKPIPFTQIIQTIQGLLAELELPEIDDRCSDSLLHQTIELDLNEQPHYQLAANYPLFGFYEDASLENIIKELDNMPNYYLPIIFTDRNVSDIIAQLDRFSDIGQITSNINLPLNHRYIAKPLGEGNLSRWDGKHLEQALFQTIDRH